MKLDPQVVAFALESEEVADSNNKTESFVKLLNVLKEKPAEARPFVVIFNCKLNSSQMRETFQYSNIISSEGDLSIEILLRMAEVFDKKLEKSLPKQKGEERVFIKKNEKASFAELLLPIKILKISETDMIIQCNQELPLGKSIRVRKPVDMFINIQPTKAQGKIPEYYGLIHAIGEEDKKELRRFVNSVFFRDHDAQLLAEKQEFKNLNDAKLQARLDAEKVAKDLAEKAAKESSEKEGENTSPSVENNKIEDPGQKV